MAQADWWRGAVIYQIYPRSSFDSNGDGVGDLPGIIARLDHVAGLGVDAIWLCPFFASPQRDFGYDIADLTAVDPLFGTMADFDALLEAAHRRGLRVLIDQVWSHTSDRHPWFKESRENRSNVLADWYVWADPAPDGTPPNNWLSVFGGSAWSWEPRRRQYFLHHFLAHQPSLNLHNPAVVDSLLVIAEGWLQRGVDGFRLDAIDFLLHDRELRSNPPAPRPAETPAKPFGMQVHRHDMMQPQAADLLARIRALTDRYPGRVTLGEVSSQPGAAQRVIASTAGDQRLHTAYTLRPLRERFDWRSVRALIRDLSAAEAGWPCWSFSNHDVERAVSRWGPARADADAAADFARLLMALLLSLRGSVCLYQGEELGLPEAELEQQHLRDPFGLAYWPDYRGRDGSCTPMPWQADAPHGGFTSGEPWLPVPMAHRHLAVDRQEADPGSVLHAYRRFLAWRRQIPALMRGRLMPVELPEPLVGFVRAVEHQQVLALFNLSDAAVTVPLGRVGPARPMPESGCAAGISGNVVRLPPFGMVFAALDAAGAGSPPELAATGSDRL